MVVENAETIFARMEVPRRHVMKTMAEGKRK